MPAAKLSESPARSGISNQFTMPFSWIGQTARLAANEGLNIGKAFSEAGLFNDGVLRAESQIGPAEFLLMSAVLIDIFDDEMHGITRQRMARGTASMAAKTMLSARDLGAAVQTVSRFFTLVGSYCRLHLRHDGPNVALQISVLGGEALISSVVEELMAQFLSHQFSYFLGFPLLFTEFTTPASTHPRLGKFHPYLLCPVRTGAVTSLVFPANYLRFSPRAKGGDFPLWDAQMFWLSNHPATRLQSFVTDGTHPLSEAVFRFLKERDLAFADCCAEMAMESEALRKGLCMEGTGYRQIRRAALIDRARPHLVGGAASEDLAALLGYSDARSFRRALKTATGLTINELRHDQSEIVAPSRILRRLKELARRME